MDDKFIAQVLAFEEVRGTKQHSLLHQQQSTGYDHGAGIDRGDTRHTARNIQDLTKSEGWCHLVTDMNDCVKMRHCDWDFSKPGHCFWECGALMSEQKCVTHGAPPKNTGCAWFNDEEVNPVRKYWHLDKTKVTGSKLWPMSCDHDCKRRGTKASCDENYLNCMWMPSDNPLVPGKCDVSCNQYKNDEKAAAYCREMCNDNHEKGGAAHQTCHDKCNILYLQAQQCDRAASELNLPCSWLSDMLGNKMCKQRCETRTNRRTCDRFGKGEECQWDDCKNRCVETTKAFPIKPVDKIEQLKEAVCKTRANAFGSCTGKHSYCNAVEDLSGDWPNWTCIPDCLAINKLALNEEWAKAKPAFNTSADKAEKYCTNEALCEWKEGACSWWENPDKQLACGRSWPPSVLDGLSHADSKSLTNTYSGGFGPPIPGGGNTCAFKRYGGGNVPIVMPGQCETVGINTYIGQPLRSTRCFEKCELRESEAHCMSPGEGGPLWGSYEEPNNCREHRDACVAACADDDNDGFKNKDCHDACIQKANTCREGHQKKCDAGENGGPTFTLNPDGTFVSGGAVTGGTRRTTGLGFLEVASRAKARFGGMDIHGFGHPGPKIPQECLSMCRWAAGKCFTSCETIAKQSPVSEQKTNCEAAGCTWKIPPSAMNPGMPISVECTGTPTKGHWPSSTDDNKKNTKELFLAEAHKHAGNKDESASGCIMEQLYSNPSAVDQSSKAWHDKQKTCYEKVELKVNEHYEEKYQEDSKLNVCRAKENQRWHLTHVYKCADDKNCESDCKENEGQHVDQQLTSVDGVVSWGTENCLEFPAFPINMVVEFSSGCGTNCDFSADPNEAGDSASVEEIATQFRALMLTWVNAQYAHHYNGQNGQKTFVLSPDDIQVVEHTQFHHVHVFSMRMTLPGSGPPDAYEYALGHENHGVRGFLQDSTFLARSLSNSMDTVALKSKLFGDDAWSTYSIDVNFRGAVEDTPFETCEKERDAGRCGQARIKANCARACRNCADPSSADCQNRFDQDSANGADMDTEIDRGLEWFTSLKTQAEARANREKTEREAVIQGVRDAGKAADDALCATAHSLCDDVDEEFGGLTGSYSGDLTCAMVEVRNEGAAT